MRKFRFEMWLAAIFVGIFLVVLVWQTPSLWRNPMNRAEIDQLSSQMAANIVLPEIEKAEFIARVRAWAERDDGGPVLMLNLMRYYDALGSLPAPLRFDGTPIEANAIYEETVAPLALERGEYPVVSGDVQSANLVGYEPALDRWDQVVVMRAPSRRAFIEFMADPAYGPVVAYKMAAAKVLLIPLTPKLELPDLRLVAAGALLATFFLVCWIRALRARSVS
jgi:hypothetical protein